MSAQHADQGYGAHRRRRTVILAGGVVLVLLLGGLGYVLGASRSQDVRAEAVVLVTPLVGNPFSPDGQGEDLLNLQSEAQLVRSDAVATLVARREDSTLRADQLLDGVSVDLPPNTQILRIGYSAANADIAAQRAQAFATEYLRFRQERAEALVAGRSAGVDSQIEGQNRRLRQLVNQRDRTNNESRQALLTTRIDATSAQIAQLRGQLAQLSLGSVDPGQVVTPASTSTTAGAPPLALLGAVAGGLLGVLLAVLAALRWWGPRPLRRHDDLARLGLPVAAAVGASRLRDGAGDGGEDGDVRDLRGAVLAALPSDGTSSRVLLAPLGAGAATSTQALATSLARASVRTIVVDLTGSLHDHVPAAGGGLDAVLRRETTTASALVQVEDDLWVLSGVRASNRGTGPDASPRVGTPAVHRLLEECAARADVVLIAGPSLRTSEGLALLARADLVLVEVDDADRSDPDVSEHVAEVLRVVQDAGTRARSVWIRPDESEE